MNKKKSGEEITLFLIISAGKKNAYKSHSAGSCIRALPELVLTLEN
jgi:hypothetical protein